MTHAGCRSHCGTVSTKRESGYSLAEALVALAIIALITLVAVPNFMQFMRSGKIKTAVRQFSSDLRGARQLAVARNLQTKISFQTGAPALPNSRVTYTIWQRRGTAPWAQPTVDGRGMPMDAIRELEESVYFDSTTFTDVDSPADGTVDVVFRQNGMVATQGTLVLKTIYQIPKQQYQIEITPAGAVRAN
jgi:Tfp pilus assembly protein FimT